MTWIRSGVIFTWLMFVVYVATADESPRRLFAMDVDGRNRQDISPRADLCYGSVCFSHNGDFLAFDAWLAKKSYGGSRVYVMERDGKDLRELGRGAFPSWSPDDKKIIFRTHASGRNIVVVDADGSGEEDLPLFGNSPRWSPDGRHIAFLDTRASAISVYDAARGRKNTVKGVALFSFWGGCWSSDGKRYCFPATKLQSAPPDSLVIVDFDQSMNARRLSAGVSRWLPKHLGRLFPQPLQEIFQFSLNRWFPEHFPS